MKKILPIVAFLIVLSAAAGLTQPGERRVALVIGNSDYQKLARLKNPANDAEDVSAALGRLGFEVTTVTDGTQAQMMEAVEGFARRLAGAKAGLFFYAGHGVQAAGVNYLVPVDAAIDSEYQLRFKAMSADYVLEAMNSARCALNIVVLDACRDNPFAGLRSAARGLAVVGNAPPGAIIVYATDPGKTAEDGSGRNGTFTAAFLKHVATPGLDVKALFDRVGAEVAERTRYAQTPWISSKFYGSFLLAGAAAGDAVPAARPAAGSIRVAVRTPGGRVFVDGQDRGEVAVEVPLTLAGVAAGSRAVEVRYPDGKVEQAAVEVEQDRTAALAFDYVSPPPLPPPPKPGEVVRVEPGTFRLGYERWESDERPVFEVSISRAYHLGRCEVTQLEWEKVMGKNPASSRGGQRPVNNVSWHEAVEFCNRLSRRDGLQPCYSGSGDAIACDFSANGWRLPTEAEWEYAARGGNRSQGFIYSGGDNAYEVAWLAGNSGMEAQPVGKKRPNELGLHDMSGNVYEWCWDWKADYAPAATDPRGAPAGTRRVYRGGAYADSLERDGVIVSLRPTFRGDGAPGSRVMNLGLRLARTAE